MSKKLEQIFLDAEKEGRSTYFGTDGPELWLMGDQTESETIDECGNLTQRRNNEFVPIRYWSGRMIGWTEEEEAERYAEEGDRSHPWLVGYPLARMWFRTFDEALENAQMRLRGEVENHPPNTVTQTTVWLHDEEDEEGARHYVSEDGKYGMVRVADESMDVVKPIADEENTE